MFSKLITTASIAALAVAGLAAPTLAETAAPAKVSSVHKVLPTPSALARTDGVQPGNAPMNWQQAGASSSAAPLGRMSMKLASTPISLTSGLDVSGYTAPNGGTWGQYWTSWMNQGYKFAFIKATEGTYYSPSTPGARFNAQWKGATNAGMIRGAYHFANPHDSSGAAQADFFIAHGGAWTADGTTLPGVLDIEYNPYSSSNGLNTCYGLSNAQMVAWVLAFSNEYKAKEGVYPIIYSTVGWWTTCTGNSPEFSKTNAFWLADPNTGSTTGGPASLSAGTTNWTFWQYGQQSSVDLNRFNGTSGELQDYATNTFEVGSHFPGGSADSLGSPIGPEIAATAFGVTGYYQTFSTSAGQITGLITSSYGTYISRDAIYRTWTPQNGGWPTSDTTAVTGDQGIPGETQTYSEGSAGASAAFATSQYGVAWLDGSVLSAYKAQGGPAWGWPKSAVQKRAAFGISGASLNVLGGRSIISSSVGTVVNNGADGGAIFASWSPSRRGWPTAAMKPLSGHGLNGYTQTFKEGAVSAQAFWTSTYGASWADGPVLNKYQSVGGPAWGWPTNSDKLSAFGIQGAYLTLQGGRAIITSSKYGTFTDGGGDHGAIVAAWSPTSKGWPMSNLLAIRARGISGYQQRFIAGTASSRAFWTTQRPTATWVTGGILKRYDALGGTPTVGWPTAAMTSQTVFAVRGWIQRFQTRALLSSRYGTYSSNGAILASWKPTLRGWPTADLKATVRKGKSGWIQTFRRGAKGVDYGFVARGSRTVTWVNGTP